MNTRQQIVLALLDTTVIEKAKKMFNPNFEFNGFNDRQPLELFDITFRLHKPTNNFVNLEFLVSSPIGRYFHPIGLYDKNGEIYLLNEFVDTFNEVREVEKVDKQIKFIDKKLNAVIAAFSMPTMEYVLQVHNEFSQNGWKPRIEHGVRFNAMFQYDKRFECNGFNCELLFSTSGYPQFYLDDEHGIEGAIGAYIKDNSGRLNIHPTVEYKELFDKANNLKLLTAFTKI